MYNGKYHMVHNPTAKGRALRYKATNGEDEILKPVGVTTVLSKTLAKDLVSWAVGCAIDLLRPKLPVVTLKDLEEAADAYKFKRDSGANTGTEAHALVEQFLKNLGNADWNATVTGSDEAMNAYQAFIKWFDEVNPEVIGVEEVVYSETFDYAGTYDCMLKINGKVYLCDLKTTNSSKMAPLGVYAENFLQLGAYAGAHEEQRQYELRHSSTKLIEIEGLMIISAKKNGKLDIVTNEDVHLPLEDCRNMFKRVINLYQFLKFTTQQLGGR